MSRIEPGSSETGATGDLLAANNLSDLDDAGDARANLGLGTASTHDDGDYDAAGAAAAVAGSLATHAADTTAVHGIADTAALALTADVVAKALFNAHTILAASVDDTPAAVTVSEDQLVGRLTGGNITSLTAAQVRTLLGLTDEAIQDIVGAMVTGGTETGISVTYDDTNGRFDFVVSGGSGDVTTNTAQTISGLKTFQPAAAGTIGLIVKGAAAQSAALLEIQDSAGAVKSYINSAGTSFYITNLIGAAAASSINLGSDLEIRPGGQFNSVIVRGATSQTVAPFLVTTSGYGVLCGVTAAGGFFAGVTAAIGSVSHALVSTAAGNVGLAVKGAASQTGNLLQLRNSSDTVLAKITAAGEYEETVAGNGVILASPDGTRYRLTIANGGAVAVAAA